MRRDEIAYLEDIVEACSKIEQYTAGFTRDDFRDNRPIIDAVVHNFAVIGEASKQIGPAIRNQMPALDWSRMAGLRDVLIHNYFGIDLDLLWDIVEARVTVVRVTIEKFLRSHQP